MWTSAPPPAHGAEEFGEEAGAFESESSFADLSLEQLMAIQVTSVAGVEQDWFTTPSAIYVITPEEIRRTGHLSIPEALRLAPGLQVGRIDAHSWAIGSRGFVDHFTNNLQVAVDGRHVYGSLFGGVLWEQVDLVLDDLDRIEVVRGPGATLWGANAVNGVINITTKSAKHTQGWLLDGVYGNEQQQASVRYGGQLGDNAWFRVWGKYRNYDQTVDASGGVRHDDWDQGRFGARLDVEGADDTTFMLDFGIYHSPRFGSSDTSADPSGPPFSTVMIVNDAAYSGGHLTARVEKGYGKPEGWALQASYDYTTREDPALFGIVEENVDVDFRHRFALGDAHAIIWGARWHGYRDRTHSVPTIRFVPRAETLQRVDGFIQDTVTLVPDRLFAMVGSKFEHNDYTGFEIQPSGRVWWTPDDRQTLWAGISRPVQTPNRAVRGLRAIAAFTGGLPIVIRGSEAVESEELLSYEAGYRVQPADTLTLNMTGFYNEYRKMIAGAMPFTNGNSGQTYGVELAGDWRPAENFSLHASYSFLEVQLHGPSEGDEDEAPHHMAQLRGSLDITRDLQFNAAAYYIDAMAGLGTPAYVRLDAGLIWRPTDWVELSVWGQNLLDPQHQESVNTTLTDLPSEIERSVYFRATFRF